jgi:tripeptide aminopeptidase
MGEVVLGAPWSRALEVRFHGRAAHAGMAPEEGRSAIQAAAKAIADLRLGRVDEVTTANVGTITGGTAGNVVPEWCTFLAEARSHEESTLAEVVQEMLDAFSFAATEAECDVETKMRKSYDGYRLKRDEPAVELAAAAFARCGFEPRYGLSGGGADANVFNGRGRRCVNLSHGVFGFHTPDEHVSVADLEGMVDVTVALVEAARA